MPLMRAVITATADVVSKVAETLLSRVVVSSRTFLVMLIPVDPGPVGALRPPRRCSDGRCWAPPSLVDEDLLSGVSRAGGAADGMFRSASLMPRILSWVACSLSGRLVLVLSLTVYSSPCWRSTPNQSSSSKLESQLSPRTW